MYYEGIGILYYHNVVYYTYMHIRIHTAMFYEIETNNSILELLEFTTSFWNSNTIGHIFKTYCEIKNMLILNIVRVFKAAILLETGVSNS